MTEGGDGVKNIVEAFFYSFRPKLPDKPETAPQNEDTLDLADPSFMEKAQDDSTEPMQQISLAEDVAQNLKDICSALEGEASPVRHLEEVKDAAKEEELKKSSYNFDEIMEQLEAPDNARRSFEFRYKNDDSDE